MRASWLFALALVLTAHLSAQAQVTGPTVTPLPTPATSRIKAIAAELAAARRAADATPARVYVIRCRIVERNDEGKEETLSRPTMMTIERGPAMIQVGQATPIVAGVQPVVGWDDGDEGKPLVISLQSGISATVTIAPESDGNVVLDASIQCSQVVSTEAEANAKKDTNADVGVNTKDAKKTKENVKRQSGRVRTHGVRIVERVALDKLIAIGIDHDDAAKSKRFIELEISEKTQK